MAKLDDGGQAFPCADPKVFPGLQPGLSVLDYFAAAALTGILASGVESASHEGDARWAYMAAEEMIEERNRRAAAHESK